MNGATHDVRPADITEIDQLATLWHEGWRDAHERIVPAALARFRTGDSFRERLRAALAEVRVTGSLGAPCGFSMLKGDELYQLFVGRQWRGAGIAALLIADAEARLAARNVDTAWLHCAIGNLRAARFYEKCGWHRAGIEVSPLETPEGVIALEVWRYEKQLR